ncbi:DUF1127 domain-containing protein [Loktanella sp. Alg231-35]|uniref:DUF1127 domain-containing protein n=1 Tax=Loktanella sp. Alg231-35 TaxID=1922220 RepID=UPI000D54BB3A|nr:DUF1127 domain-containing protein [Loktanella sp. Alg231-35]
MAFYTNTVTSRPAASGPMAFFSAVATFVENLTDARSRSVEVARMQHLSDRELANIGVSRESIVRCVYGDIYNC